jgi:peptide/nickel transport system permease protein
MTEAYAPPLVDIAGPSPQALLRRRVLAHKGLMIGATVLVLIVLMAALAPLLAPHDPYAQDLSRRLIPPIWHAKGTWAYPFGTDNLGRDYLSRVIYGARISLLIGFAVMVISGLIGAALGLAAGYFGGRVDMAVTFIITVRLAMPLILVALAVVAWCSACSNGTASRWSCAPQPSRCARSTTSRRRKRPAPRPRASLPARCCPTCCRISS